MGYALCRVMGSGLSTFDTRAQKFLKDPGSRGALLKAIDKTVFAPTCEFMKIGGASAEVQAGFKGMHKAVKVTRDVDFFVSWAQQRGGVKDIRDAIRDNIGMLGKDKELHGFKFAANIAKAGEKTGYLAMGPIKAAMFGDQYFGATYGKPGKEVMGAIAYVTAFKDTCSVAKNFFELAHLHQMDKNGLVQNQANHDKKVVKKSLKLVEKGVAVINHGMKLSFTHVKRMPNMPSWLKVILPAISAGVGLYGAWRDTA